MRWLGPQRGDVAGRLAWRKQVRLWMSGVEVVRAPGRCCCRGGRVAEPGKVVDGRGSFEGDEMICGGGWQGQLER